MSTQTPYETFDAQLQATKREAAWRDNPYFLALSEGRFDREDFVETQIQFYFAVVFFSRPMAVLMARLPWAELRRSLLENVHEEHGGGDLARTHGTTFVELLGRFGVAPDDVDARALWPEVRAFDTVLSGLSLLDDTPTGLAAFGMIEDLFSEISGFLGVKIAEAGWVPRERIVHYATHETLDVAHAEEFYALLRPLWERSPKTRYQISQGLELGAYVFLRMYRDLYESRGRRALRDIRGPHTRADSWEDL